MSDIDTSPYTYTIISGLSLKDRMECSKRESISFRSFETYGLPEQKTGKHEPHNNETTPTNEHSGVTSAADPSPSKGRGNIRQTLHPSFNALSIFSDIWRSIWVGFSATFLYTLDPELRSTNVNDDILGLNTGFDQQLGYGSLGMLGRRGSFAITGFK